MRTFLIASLAAAAITATPAAMAATGVSSFEPLPGSAYGSQPSLTEPFLVPDGFCQTKVWDGYDVDVYPGRTDNHDMNTLNETRQQAGRYLWTTHEVSRTAVSADGRVGASISAFDTRTGAVTTFFASDFGIDKAWASLDGITWTPWGTVLFAEEVDGGRLYEGYPSKSDPSVLERVELRDEVGILKHEGIGIDAAGNVYVIDENNGGGIFKFAPARRGDLSDGQLYTLKLTGLADAEQKWGSTSYLDKAGAFEWVALDMDQVVVDADAAADAVSGTEFGRPEDIEIIGRQMYVANTSEDRVVEIDLHDEVLGTYVAKGVNMPAEDQAAGVTGFNNPDNLASSADGTLYIAEDNDFSDVWVADADVDRDGQADSVRLFSSLKDAEAETTGIYFAPSDPGTLYLNIQHPSDHLADGVWKIRACR